MSEAARVERLKVTIFWSAALVCIYLPFLYSRKFAVIGLCDVMAHLNSADFPGKKAVFVVRRTSVGVFIFPVREINTKTRNETDRVFLIHTVYGLINQYSSIYYKLTSINQT